MPALSLPGRGSVSLKPELPRLDHLTLYSLHTRVWGVSKSTRSTLQGTAAASARCNLDSVALYTSQSSQKAWGPRCSEDRLTKTQGISNILIQLERQQAQFDIVGYSSMIHRTICSMITTWYPRTPLLDDKLARIRCSAIDALVALWEPVDLESHWANDTFEAACFHYLLPESLPKCLSQHMSTPSNT